MPKRPSVGVPARRRRANGEGSIYHRSSDNRWVGSAYVYTTTGQRRRKTVYGDSFDEVRTKLDKVKGDAANGVLIPDKQITVAEYLGYWLREVVVHKCATTARGYEAQCVTYRASAWQKTTRLAHRC